MALSKDEILRQSKNAFAQWESTWREYAKINGEIYRQKGISFQDLAFTGVGRTALCIGFAPSFENKIQEIKDNINRGSTDIICVDKALGKLIEHGIIPDYVVTCDSGVSYEKWCEPYLESTKDIILLANINSNIEWTRNWKGGICFFVHKDNIQSEEIFTKISGCNEMIPAGSNVGNSVCVFATHVLQYDEYLLVGYDFCWGDDDNYYAFNDSDKRYWMKHSHVIDNKGRIVYTSNNLQFSCKWLADFYTKVVTTGKIKMFNCSEKGILPAMPMMNLKNKLKRAKQRILNQDEKQVIMKNKIKQKVFTMQNNNEMTGFIKTHNITNIVANYISKEDMQWLN